MKPSTCLRQYGQWLHGSQLSRATYSSISTHPESQRAHAQPSRVPSSRASFASPAIRQQDLIQTGDSVLPDLPSPLQPPSSSSDRGQTEPQNGESPDGPRLPRSVQAIYLKPLRRKPKYGVPVCDLQLRSYSVRNLEFFADFALRAAYYLNLPASGPVPLPRITERWTVPRSNFIFKKSQENFERITLRRLIQIQDGNTETVSIWLAFLRKHMYYGIGVKANVWEYEKLGVGKTMDVSLENLKQALEPKWAHFGRRKNLETSEKVFQMLQSDSFRNGSTSVSDQD